METHFVEQPGTPECMLVSVGGSPAPVIKSVELNRPEKLVFFVSRGSYDSVTRDILPSVMQALGRLPPHEIVMTGDEQDVGESTFALLRGVPAAMRKLAAHGEWPERVDFTGGTKVMSAALVWASSRFPCTFSYIGSDTPEARTRGGLGVVVDGNERCLLLENPWNKIAYYDVQQATTLFNGGQYANAVASMSTIVDRVSDPQRERLLSLILGVWRGYAAWDVFDHPTAVREFGANLQPMLDLAALETATWPGLLDFAEATREQFKILREIPTKPADALSWSKIHDLVANAMRRARLEHKYDDATARCYAGVEKYGKHALKLRHGLDNGNCRFDQVHDSLREEYSRRYGTGNPHRPMQFGLEATYRLLVALEDPVGLRYMECREELEKVLQLRNASILGHGTARISSENFERLLAVTLRMMDVRESDLTVFPTLCA